MVNILAIDPGELCGWAHSNGSSGVWRLKANDREPRGRRLCRLVQRICDAAQTLGVDVIAYEHAAFGTKILRTVESHGQMAGAIMIAAEHIGADIVCMSPATIKKFATGKGNAKKPQMIEACRKRLGVSVIDDNEADAIWVLRYVESLDEPTKVA